MLINQQIHIKGGLDIRHCSSDIKYHAVGMLVGHGQIVRLSKGDDRLIILHGRTKTFGELRWCEVLTKIRAGRVVNLLKKVFEALLVAERQPDRKVQDLRAVKLPYRRPIGCRFATAAGTVSDITWLAATAGTAANKRLMAAASAKVPSGTTLRRKVPTATFIGRSYRNFEFMDSSFSKAEFSQRRRMGGLQ